MLSAAIDRNTLNSLFDNQKKLDDLFDSIFDDENYFISSVSAAPAEKRPSYYDAKPAFAPKRSGLADSLETLKSQCPYFFMLPIVLEIAAIYFIVANFF